MLQRSVRQIKKQLISSIPFLITIIGVIMVWRGIWNLLDHYFFPHNRLLSNIGTIIMGIILIVILLPHHKKGIEDIF
ncbi:MAG: hypothetical protein CO170_01845 [candidate division SR1 bacterium CG_4_9_14_3_um_filter_40_9]|nr:MAG: hypothetical protein CO170_01845 [candidate division SR1 bacterium CG_4_9_14_3_um_filter_40_9]